MTIGNIRRSMVIGNRTAHPSIITIVGKTSPDQDYRDELDKALAAQKLGTDLIADVSTEGDLHGHLSLLVSELEVPVCSVPAYSIFGSPQLTDGPLGTLDVIRAQAEIGVACMTVHASLSRNLLKQLKGSNRLVKIQGRGPGYIHDYIKRTGNENPFLLEFDSILEILKSFHVALSLGNCTRSSMAVHGFDEIAVAEVLQWKPLIEMARAKGVEVMVEAPSHLQLHLIGSYIDLVRTVCGNVSVRFLGPIGTEKGLGLDVVTGAIGAYEAIKAGADFVTCVTRAEHIGLPTINDVREAVTAVRISRELATCRTNEHVGEYANKPSTCGLGFESCNPEMYFNFDLAYSEKLERNGGNASRCTMCGTSCPIRK